MQKMMKGVKSVRCLQGAGVTIGKWVVGIPHEQPIGDGAPRYSAECIWRVSTYTTLAGHTHTHTHSQVHETHKYTYTKLSICAGNLRCCTKIQNVRRRSVIG